MGSEQCCHLIFVLVIIFRKCRYTFEKLLAVEAFSVNQSLMWKKTHPKSDVACSYKWKLMSLIPESAGKPYKLSLSKHLCYRYIIIFHFCIIFCVMVGPIILQRKQSFRPEELESSMSRGGGFPGHKADV